MVGLSVVLENYTGGGELCKKPPQVINKATMLIGSTGANKPSPSPPLPSPFRSTPRRNSHTNLLVPSPFQKCFLCGQKFLPGRDIYMYKERAFCSVKCRCGQIFMDEEGTIKKENCSLAAIKPAATRAPSSSSPLSSSAFRHGKATRNRAGDFAY